MRDIHVLVYFLVFASVAAAPAIVWRDANHGDTKFIHESNAITSEGLLGEFRLDTARNSSRSSVIFLIGRTQDGAESLSLLASQNALPNVALKKDSARRVYHHVSGIESITTVQGEAKRLGRNSVVLNLVEFNELLPLLDTNIDVEVVDDKAISKFTPHRWAERDNASVYIVKVDASTDPKLIDASVVGAIESSQIDAVVLSAIRSVEEVKLERERLSRRRLEVERTSSKRSDSGSRRLEEVQEAGVENDNVSVDFSGVYYVSLTPNILAGLLFFFLFSTIIYIGVGCMGMISGQDVFATKMPAVGREA
jgi:hypothetical protein